MNTPNNLQDIKTGRSELSQWLNKHYPEFYEFLIKKYQNIPIKEQLYLYFNNLTTPPTCHMCGKPVKFHGYSYGYAKYCGPTCAQKDENTQLKIKRTCLEKYGDDFNINKVNKIKQTKLVRYGDANYNNTDKSKQTCLAKYGVDNPMKLNDIKNKSKQTCLEKYGVEYVLQSDEVRRKINNRIFENMKLKDSNIINWDKKNNILTCKCPDPDCNLCHEKIYNTTYYSYYERNNIYHICPCTKKIPPYTNTTYSNTNIEIFVQNILDEQRIKYIKNTKNSIPPKELDFFIPEMNVAIECNGVYWHSSKFNDIKTHYNKYKYCEKNGIQLLSIWEDQIVNKPDIVKSIILSKLGIYNKKIGARKCVIKEIDSKKAKMFLNENHLQGAINSSIRLGLYYNDELVSIMCFGKKRVLFGNTNKHIWELYRFCNKLNTQIIGGASKLFNYFIKTYNAEYIESYSSNDISNGKLYEKLGFNLTSESISYWYIKDKQRYHRYKFRKSELVKMGFDKNKTEFQIMEENKYYRIYDTGQKKWIYINESNKIHKI